MKRFEVPEDIINMSDKELLRQLVEGGDTPGPLNDCTRRVFQIRLTKLRELTKSDETPAAADKLSK